MGQSEEQHALSALRELLSTWEFGNKSYSNSVNPVDTRRLDRLVSDPEMDNVWKALSNSSKSEFGEVAVKLLVSELFLRAIGLPLWEAETAKDRRKRVDQIIKTAGKLRSLLVGSPLRHISPDALGRMQLDPRFLDEDLSIVSSAESDFDEVLRDLEEQARSWQDWSFSLSHPAREDSHRRYFVLSINDYLTRNFRAGLNREIAVFARIMLRDPEIDTEVVRKIIGPSGKPRGRPRK